MNGTPGRGIEAGFVIILELQLVEGLVPGFTIYRTVEPGPQEVEF